MNKFEELLFNQMDVTVLAPTVKKSAYVPIDLSINNKALFNFNINDPQEFEDYINSFLKAHQRKIAYGGYLEKRAIYQISDVFKNTAIERDIHIGLDLWIEAGTPVVAALDGIIHSFQDNTARGDYGPTIILQHELEGIVFYTLYGHLAKESLKNLIVGQTVNKGEEIAKLGAPPIKGNYAPHLHFQIIKDIENKVGDYPGVCNIESLDFYKNNCPDPNLLLKINSPIL